MRAPIDTIVAPLFPTRLPWVNAGGGAGGGAAGGGTQASIIQRGRPMLVEFWDFCRPNSLRTLPYLKAWHERYAEHGLRTIGVHCPGFEPARDEGSVREAVARLGVEYPVLIDSELVLWREYENRGWPARYLFDGRARLFDYHYGEGGYVETELAIQELLDVEREPLAPLRPEDAPGARLVPQTEDQPGLYSGPYEAGGVWTVLDGSGIVRFATSPGHAAYSGVAAGAGNGASELTVTHPGAYRLIEHDRHTAGVLELEIGPGVRCHATCFTPGVA
ncbi:MAG TPA: DipZ protein [Solirubrobacteraceae bacterium]|nr:DipZ protein [Solirubrobacteraceae bacterium]